MSTGTKTDDNRVSTPWYVNGSYAGDCLIGNLRHRSWAGGDSIVDRPHIPRVKRVYTYIDSRGKLRKRSLTPVPPRRSRVLEPNDYTVDLIQRLSPQGDFTLQSNLPGYGQDVVGVDPLVLFSGYPTLPTWTDNDQIKLINRLKSRSRGAEFNLGVFLGEGREALRMLGDSAMKIAKAISYLKSGNVLGAIRSLARPVPSPRRNGKVIPKTTYDEILKRFRKSGLKEDYVVNRSGFVDWLSSSWLALEWGWKPLVADIRSAAEFTAHKLNVPFRQRVVARVTVKRDHSADNAAYDWAGGVGSVSKQIVAYFTEPESIPKLLGLKDPEVVLWNVLPFSCLLDYVLPIGDWLEARAYSHGLVGKYVETTFSKMVAKGLQFKEFAPSPGYTASWVGDDKGCYLMVASVTRSITASLAVPKPKLIDLSKDLSWKHAVNSIAVLAAVTRSTPELKLGRFTGA